jgi:homoserine dehydrogenase
MKNIQVGIIGLGTVGSGVAEALERNQDLIKERSGVVVSLKYACDKDLSVLEKLNLSSGVIKTNSYEDILKDPDIDVVVELVGGIEPAFSMIKGALSAGKHVVTANKALLSEKWKEIFELASSKKLFVKFEASVGGAIPIIRTLRESFVGNRISAVYGILNGTTNFILTTMESGGVSFEDALKVAQEKGIAESDPSLDISGADSAHKLAILALLCFSQEVYSKDVYTEGISALDVQDITNARKLGYAIKLLGIAKDSEKGLELRVHPTLLRSKHLLSGVSGADNAIYVKGDLIGESLLFGKGAGKLPTASSVVGDLVEIATLTSSVDGGKSGRSESGYAPKKLRAGKMEDMKLAYYMRFSVTDKPGVLAGISGILSENNISIANVSQEERNEGETVPVVILTHKAKEGDMRTAISKIDSMDYVSAKTVVIRIED